MLKPVAGAVDPHSRQILAGGEAEQSPDSLIELERRKARACSHFRNTQGLAEMIVDIGERS